jgi:translation elongation factor EF-1beta
MSPERLQEIEDAIRDIRKHVVRLSNRDERTIVFGLVGIIVELIAEIRASWDDNKEASPS